jgi:CheY-like chemotaxis protein
MLKVKPEQIAFMRNTSDGFATVANGLKWKKGDNIVTFEREFPANFYAWRRVRDVFDVELRLCPERNGRIDLDEFINLIDKNTRLVSISAVDTRQLLVQSLTFYGATVITANSAEQAFSELQDKNPDVLVSDIGMPDEDGYSLIRRVRMLANPQHRDVPAIALTAFTRAQDRMRALTSGYQNHVSKPVEPDELATVIASLTGRLQKNEAKNN